MKVISGQWLVVSAKAGILASHRELITPTDH
jgi:hypothetical protein